MVTGLTNEFGRTHDRSYMFVGNSPAHTPTTTVACDDGKKAMA